MINFVGVGAPKCGSMTIMNHILYNSNIGGVRFVKNDPYSKLRKETHYFSRGIRKNVGYDKYDRGFDDKPITGEWTSFYHLYKESLLNIRDYNKDIKILISTRNPVKRIYSQYNTYYRLRTLEKPEGLKQFLTFDQEHSFETSVHNELPLFDKRTVYFNSRYADIYENVLSIFPEENVLIFKFEDFLTGGLEGINKIQRFLGAKEAVKFSGIHNKSNKAHNYLTKDEKSSEEDNIKNMLASNMDKLYKMTGIDYRF